MLPKEHKSLYNRDICTYMVSYCGNFPQAKIEVQTQVDTNVMRVYTMEIHSYSTIFTK